MATKGQQDLCRAILRNCFTAFNYAKPPEGYIFCDSDFTVWSDSIHDHRADVQLPKGRALSGLIGSAVQAGLITSNGENIQLKQAGYDLAIQP